MRRSIIVVLMFAVLATPLWADVLPVRRAAATADASRVTERVTAMGVKDAPAHVAALTESDRAYFASHPERVQVVGAQDDFFSGSSQNLWYETLAGAGMLAVGMAAIWLMVTNNE